MAFKSIALFGKLPLVVACTCRLKGNAGIIAFSLIDQISSCLATDSHNLQRMSTPFIVVIICLGKWQYSLTIF